MLNRIERYVLWLAPALVIQLLARHLAAGPGLEQLQAPAIWFLLHPADVVSLGAVLALLPTIVTAVWVTVDSGSPIVVRVAWFVCALLMSYFVLVPYVGYLLLREQDASRQSV